ncbi:hypothetical protein M0804_013867 [Polistes exclamans]|nr:hypothetical protein M0804_013867 [Polistes exclamans]
MSTIDISEYPYEISLMLNKPYILIINVDVADGLANGALEKLIHIEYGENREVIRVWLEFQEHPEIAPKIRKKAGAYIQANGLSRTAVLIGRRTSTIPLNNNKTIIAKRRHLPIVPALAITSHKSQGATFDQVVYQPASVNDLQNEFQRLNLNQLQTLQQSCIDFVTNKRGLSFTSFNCQSLRVYYLHMDDAVIKRLRTSY